MLRQLIYHQRCSWRARAEPDARDSCIDAPQRALTLTGGTEIQAKRRRYHGMGWAVGDSRRHQGNPAHHHGQPSSDRTTIGWVTERNRMIEVEGGEQLLPIATIRHQYRGYRCWPIAKMKPKASWKQQAPPRKQAAMIEQSACALRGWHENDGNRSKQYVPTN